VILSDLAKYSVTRSTARPLCVGDSWASCFLCCGDLCQRIHSFWHWGPQSRRPVNPWTSLGPGTGITYVT